MESMPSSLVMDEMILNIGAGDSRVEKVHRMALALHYEGRASEQVGAFASCGDFGNHAQNIERDLHRWARCLHSLQLEPYMLRMKMYNPRVCDIVDMEAAAMPPHDMVP